jgi:hypothetical protein
MIYRGETLDVNRYLRHGPAGLEERSRRPRHSPRHASEEIVTAILDARRRHPRWSGKKLLALRGSILTRPTIRLHFGP